MGIARWIEINFEKEGGSAFNSYLRTAIKKGLESGVLREGETAQRFKIGELPKAVKPKKKTASKKEGRIEGEEEDVVLEKEERLQKEDGLKEEELFEEEDCVEKESVVQKEDGVEEEDGDEGLQKEGGLSKEGRLQKEE